MENDLSGGQEENDIEGTRGLERIGSFSDGVFAVAITLLILGIDVPVVDDIGELPSALRALWPKFLAFIISFALIGFFWVAHHVIFRYLRRHSPGLLWLNLLFLMFIVLLPFSTNLMSEYNSSMVAVMFYDANMALAGLTLCLLWRYMTHKNRLVDEDLDPPLRKHLMLVYLSISVVFLVSMAVALVNVGASQYLYYLIIPLTIILERLHKREEKKIR